MIQEHLKALKGLAPLPVRLMIGYGFFAHGIAKVARGPEHFVSIIQALGIPFGEPMAWFTIGLELICGAMMIAGFLVPLIALPMLAILAVAIVTVHAQFGFSSIKLLDVTSSGPRFGPPGMETDLLYIAGIAALVLGGPGPFAVDHWLRRQFSRARRSRS
jgi:putative oxidoreductase